MAVDASETRVDSPRPPPAPVGGFTPGTIVAERYRIVALAGRGGMGDVYRADDLRLGQTVALKFLPVRYEHDPAARERLLAEVRTARLITHPNVCRVYDVGDIDGPSTRAGGDPSDRSGRGRTFLTMEFIDGEDLASLLRRIGRLSPAKALDIARQLCAGLAAAHDQGVLHRDLKPANVMIDGRGHARITDFGLAVTEAGPGEGPEPDGPAVPGRKTREAAEWAGTIAYMAPERFAGKPATVQSDLYALGLILFEAYTGKPAIAPGTSRAGAGAPGSLLDWQRAHAESAPASPSAHVREIEPPVERAILRCLEKDPAARPVSAAQVAASLPGGDPLAAAIAAGETPSPELVAASGEEGTLPRARAWRWFVASVAAIVLAVPLGRGWYLENMSPLDAPALQSLRAQQIARSLGYTKTPKDTAWWFEVDSEYMTSLVANPSPKRRFAPPPAGSGGPFLFCYRQRHDLQINWLPVGPVSPDYPAPLFADDLYMEFDQAGHLRTLRGGGVSRRYQPTPLQPIEPDWRPLLAAAGLDPGVLARVEPRWLPTFPFDARAAWDGHLGRDPVRVDAAAWAGRPIDFSVRPETSAAQATADPPRADTPWIFSVPLLVVTWGMLGSLALLARHNVKKERGDRQGALRLAGVVTVAEVVAWLSYRQWTPDPMEALNVPAAQLGYPLMCGLGAWLCYLAFEPFVRRRWPHLLVAWTRLLDGRWRDPLVGRSLLAGTTAAAAVAVILPGLLAVATRLFDLPMAVPWGSTQLNQGPAWFLTRLNAYNVGPLVALVSVSQLLVFRFVTRSDRAAWLVLFGLTVAFRIGDVLPLQPWMLASPFFLVILVALPTLGYLIVLSRFGLLGAAVFATADMALVNTPLTWDVTCWYFWRTAVVVAMLLAVAYWGFRNVLGRQTAFPEGALEG